MSDNNRPKLSLKRDAGPRVEERLHKVLAQAGLGSRRALEERIATGQVKVNGEVASTGSSIKSGDRVELDGRAFIASAQVEPPRVLIYHKPEGELTTRDDPEGRPTVFDSLPPLKGARWIAVGRLDINTTGLLVLTTDGELANVLMHPSTEIKRNYVCRIHGEVSDDVVQTLRRGVELEDGAARFDDIESIGSSDSHAWFSVSLHEGRNREVRRMWEAVGFQVSRLKRVSYGSIELPRELRRGQHRELSPEEAIALRASVGLAAVAPTLTLQSVIGQRKAKAAEYRPAPREQRAWTQGSYGDEGRELRAFDNIRDDRPGRPGGRGKPSGKPGARGKKPFSGPRPAKSGGAHTTLTAPAGQPRGGRGGPAKRRGAAPGFENSSEFRTWYVPDGVTTTSPGARPGPRPGGRTGDANRDPNRAPRGPRPGGPGGRPGGDRPRSGAPSGPGDRKPGGRPGGARPGGARPGGSRPGGRPGGKPGGGKPGGGGRGGPRGNS